MGVLRWRKTSYRHNTTHGTKWKWKWSIMTDREMEILRGLNDLVPFVRLIVEDTDMDTYNEHTYETKRTWVFFLILMKLVVISHSSIHIQYIYSSRLYNFPSLKVPGGMCWKSFLLKVAVPSQLRPLSQHPDPCTPTSLPLHERSSRIQPTSLNPKSKKPSRIHDHHAWGHSLSQLKSCLKMARIFRV